MALDLRSRLADPRLQPLLDELCGELVGVLEDRLVAIYLFGSAVAGGFEPDASDLDLVAVTSCDAAELDLPALSAMHGAFVARHPDWLDRLEIVYVGAATLLSFRDGGRLAVVSPGEPFHLRHDAQDWLENWYLVREQGVALFGPPPDALIPEISRPDFLEGIRWYVAELRGRDYRAAQPRDRAYAVLTLCRASRTLATGAPCTKQDGAQWLRDREPDRAWIVDAALACSRARGREGFATPEMVVATEEFVRDVAGQLLGSADGDRR